MKLKPCPFCGSRKSEIVTGSYTVDHKKTETQNVLCGNCNAMGPDTLMGEDRAGEKWNRRRCARVRVESETDKLQTIITEFNGLSDAGKAWLRARIS